MTHGGVGTVLDGAAVRRCLPKFFGQVEVVASLPSTMVRAGELAASGAPEGTVVLADVQTAGRGRLGRRWTTPPGAALMLSVVLRPQLPPARTWMVLAAAGVALVDAVAGLFGQTAGTAPHATVRSPSVALKWPNDLLVGGRKAAGLLAERQTTPPTASTGGVLPTTARGIAGAGEAPGGGAVILGMGVNVTQTRAELPEEVRDHATSLALAAAAAGLPAPGRLALLEAWAGNFAARYLALGADGAGILPDYRRRLGTLGQPVRVDRLGGPPLDGRAVGVQPDGSLVIELPDGRRAEATTGDVEHLRPACAADPGPEQVTRACAGYPGLRR